MADERRVWQTCLKTLCLVTVIAQKLHSSSEGHNIFVYKVLTDMTFILDSVLTLSGVDAASHKSNSFQLPIPQPKCSICNHPWFILWVKVSNNRVVTEIKLVIFSWLCDVNMSVPMKQPTLCKIKLLLGYCCKWSLHPIWEYTILNIFQKYYWCRDKTFTFMYTEGTRKWF